MGNGLLPISNPHSSENWDPIESYAKVPAVLGRLTDGAYCWLEETERELAVSLDEFISDSECSPHHEIIICRCR